MREKIGAIGVACVLIVIGIASGWYAASQKSGGGAGADPHAGHDHAAGEAGALTEQALKNLGVTVGEVQLGTFVRTVRVQATVVDTPLNDQPVPALFGGVVTALHVAPGQVVKAGDPVATITRGAIARPQLALAAEILDPVSEDLHSAVAALRTAIAELRTRERELERVQKFIDGDEEFPIVPRSRLLELQYKRDEARQKLENAQHELEWHGLSEEEIEAVSKGERPPPTRKMWRRALEQNGLWGETETAILNGLPANFRDYSAQ